MLFGLCTSRWSTGPAALATSMLLACSGVAETINVPQNWKRVDAAGPFSFSCPPDVMLDDRGRAPYDSVAGQYRGASLWITYDYGPYSNPLPGNVDSGFRWHKELIGGKVARIVSYSLTKPYQGYIHAVGASFSRINGPKMRLTVEVYCSDLTSCIDGETLLRSIRFH